jgi:hypothetical protein
MGLAEYVRFDQHVLPEQLSAINNDLIKMNGEMRDLTLITRDNYGYLQGNFDRLSNESNEHFNAEMRDLAEIFKEILRLKDDQSNILGLLQELADKIDGMNNILYENQDVTKKRVSECIKESLGSYGENWTRC